MNDTPLLTKIARLYQYQYRELRNSSDDRTRNQIDAEARAIRDGKALPIRRR